MKAFEEGRFEDATAAFEKCVQSMPRHAYAHYYLANLAYIKADFERALTDMERSLGDFDFMEELGEHAARLKLKKIDSYEQMLAAEWDNTNSCRESRELEAIDGQLTDEKGRLELAARKAREARIKQKAHYLYFLGNILFQLKRFPEASRRYGEAIELDPRHADAYNNLAAISYLAGDHAAAGGHLAQAEARGLGDNINLKLKHLVYEALGRPTEGILREDLSAPGDDGLGVFRFALAYMGEGSMRPPLYVNAYVVFDRGTRNAVLVDPASRTPGSTPSSESGDSRSRRSFSPTATPTTRPPPGITPAFTARPSARAGRTPRSTASRRTAPSKTEASSTSVDWPYGSFPPPATRRGASASRSAITSSRATRSSKVTSEGSPRAIRPKPGRPARGSSGSSNGSSWRSPARPGSAPATGGRRPSPTNLQ